jgi:murein tripeptide amidase MpaA
MPEVRFDRYYRHDELTELLEAYAREYPQLVELESIGTSFEGRAIWLITVTNAQTGPAAEKPALWIDGNIHASEVSPSTMCLYQLQTLVTSYGRDDAMTRCLDTRAFYLCPRVNPDGAEWMLADRPRVVRSGTRPYPFDEDPLDGLLEEDIDGDGRILRMRIPDPNGAWKQHPAEPRLLTRRDADEVEGTFYRLLVEGRVVDYDGATIHHRPPKQGLDFNRNFPVEWRQEHEQRGAGPYPTSEPEVRAVVEFITRHPNITGGISFHTHGGVLLRPMSTRADDTLPAEDLWTFQTLGAKGTALTGYPHLSVFHGFKYHPKEVITGGFDDWLYDHLGVFAWTVELWSPQREAGIEEYDVIDWHREHPVGDDLAMLAWSDERLRGRGHVDWYRFEHPQLGTVELGGWDHLYAFRNPPPEFLERELARFPQWLVWHLAISPKLELLEASATQVGEDLFRVRVIVQNTGWLPSYVTKQALAKGVVRGMICELDLPAGAALESGQARTDLGQLEGRAYVRASPSVDSTTERAKAEWVVRALPGTRVGLVARHDRAGVARTTIVLGDAGA